MSNSFEEFSRQYSPIINKALEGYIKSLSVGCPAQLSNAMSYSLLSNGKRLRPLLTLMACDVCNGKIEEAMPAACAVEMVHAYSLIHDDLPAMDDDDERRGKPSLHIKFGEGQAILAGDALLTLAFDILAKQIQPPEFATACIRTLSTAIGPTGMVGGQSDDLLNNASLDLNSLESMYRRKTGALIEASLLIGGIISVGTQDQLTALENFGRAIGLSYQYIDDLEDDSDSVEMFGADDSRKKAEALILQAQESLEVFGDSRKCLFDFAEKMKDRSK